MLSLGSACATQCQETSWGKECPACRENCDKIHPFPPTGLEKVLKVAVGFKRGDRQRKNKLLRPDSPGLAREQSGSLRVSQPFRGENRHLLQCLTWALKSDIPAQLHFPLGQKNHPRMVLTIRPFFTC